MITTDTTTTISSETIMNDVIDLLGKLASDWEYSGEISTETFLFADLGFESIDAVVLASHIQKYYARQFPFPELLAELGSREVKDIQIRELVDFISTHLNGDATGGV